MTQPNGANGSGSPTDEKLVPLENMRGEMNRKLQEMDEKMAQRMETLSKQLEALTTEPEPEPEPNGNGGYDNKEELRRISTNVRGYLDEFAKPLREQNDKLMKQVEQSQKLLAHTLWEKQEERIARREGKESWDALPKEMQSGVIGIIKEKGWGSNPNAAMDAYDLYQVRVAKAAADDPDRAARINSSTTEGSGRPSGKATRQTLSRDELDRITSLHPTHADYKESRRTLDGVTSGRIRIE